MSPTADARSRHVRTLGATIGFFVGFVFFVGFGFLGDRPSRVRDPQAEGVFVSSGQWASAVFHAGLALYLTTTYGPVGFLSLALSILIVARRLSASRGVAYLFANLLEDIRTVLTGRLIRNMAVYSTGAAVVLGILHFFKLPTNVFAAVAATVSWGVWMVIAAKASKVNVAVELAERASQAADVALLASVFSTPVAEWGDSVIRREGNKIVVDNPPLKAVVHRSGAEAILSLVAPELELAPDSGRLVLVGASEETLSRREMEARTGGLIAGRVEPAPGVLPALATAPSVAFTADDLI